MTDIRKDIHFQIWAPFGFCLGIILVGWTLDCELPLLAFLPMCFWGVAQSQLSLLERLRELEARREERNEGARPDP